MNSIEPQFRSEIYNSKYHETVYDEIMRIKFQCSALRKRLSDENELRSEICELKKQLSELSGQLSSAVNERDRLAETLKATGKLCKEFLVNN